MWEGDNLKIEKYGFVVLEDLDFLFWGKKPKQNKETQADSLHLQTCQRLETQNLGCCFRETLYTTTTKNTQLFTASC